MNEDKLIGRIYTLILKNKKNDLGNSINSSQQSFQNQLINVPKTNINSQKTFSIEITPKLQSRHIKGFDELIIRKKHKENINDLAQTEIRIKTLSLFCGNTGKVTKSKTTKSKRVSFHDADFVDIIDIVSYKEYNKLPLSVLIGEIKKDQNKNKNKENAHILQLPHECPCILI